MENLGIYKAIAGVIADIGTVGKNGTNKQQGFKYRTVDDVYSALNPALAKNKMFILPEVLEMQKEIKTSKAGGTLSWVTLKMKYTLFAEDGSFVTTVLQGEAFDTGDKAINKAMAITYKYLCFQIFCIPVEDMSDPDKDKHELGKEQKQEHKQQPKPQNKITEDMERAVYAELERTGIQEEAILKALKGKNYKQIKEMDIQDFNYVMKRLENTPAKQGENFKECMSM